MWKSVLYKVNTAVQGIWAIPFVIVIRLIGPFFTIRIGSFYSSRIAHFVFDSTIKYIAHHEKSRKNIDLYFLPHDRFISNTCWLNVVKRNFFINPLFAYLERWNRFIPGGSAHVIPEVIRVIDVNGLLENTKPRLDLLPKEKLDGKKWLRSQGWKDGEPFVCLQVRDSAYLDSTKVFSKFNYSYHSYRDSDISTYIEAINWLSDQGVWVIRMGKAMNKKIYSSNYRVIDYAFHSEKSDLLDIWLFSNCNLCISTGTGPDIISAIFQKPIMFVNFLPLDGMFYWTNSINYPKRLLWSSSTKLLSASEYLEHAHSNSVDLSSKEILGSFQECWKRIKGEWVDTKEDVEKQTKFWKVFKQSDAYKRYNGFISSKAYISSTFIRENPTFILEK